MFECLCSYVDHQQITGNHITGTQCLNEAT